MNDIVYQVTPSSIEEYIAHLEERGLPYATRRNYRHILESLYEFLPDDKNADWEIMRHWQEDLSEKGYALESVRLRTRVVNRFFQYLNRVNGTWALETVPGTSVKPQPELTRSEYIRLLQMAKHLGQRRIYLIIKTIANMGLKVQELEYITVEAVREGYIILTAGKKKRILRFPNTLIKDIREYISDEGIVEGYVFRTRNGLPINRSNIWREIQNICHDARVPEEKGSPIQLMKLYKTTYGTIEANAQIWIDQTYERMLEEEQLLVDWNEN